MIYQDMIDEYATIFATDIIETKDGQDEDQVLYTLLNYCIQGVEDHILFNGADYACWKDARDVINAYLDQVEFTYEKDVPVHIQKDLEETLQAWLEEKQAGEGKL